MFKKNTCDRKKKNVGRFSFKDIFLTKNIQNYFALSPTQVYNYYENQT